MFNGLTQYLEGEQGEGDDDDDGCHESFENCLGTILAAYDANQEAFTRREQKQEDVVEGGLAPDVGGAGEYDDQHQRHDKRNPKHSGIGLCETTSKKWWFM